MPSTWTSRLFGIEIEYGGAVRNNGGHSRREASLGLVALAQHHMASLPGAGGIFLGNGGHLLVDTGGHPELASPEVDSPDDCVRYVVAGDRLLRDLLARAGGDNESAARLALFKTNVDYLSPGTTWGCHESYLYRRDPTRLPPQLMPFLVSRIWCGAGGLDPRARGIRFSMSPRAHLLNKAISDCSTSARGIWHTRDESLAERPYRRIHLICGDSVCSQRSLWLKVATTGLVLALAEAGLRPARRVQLASPVKALHAFATDPHFRTTAMLADGTRQSALELQHGYLDQVEKHLGHECLPPWAEEACAAWRDTLERLARGPEATCRQLDWSIKLALFRDHLERSGIDESTLELWNEVLLTIETKLRAAGGGQLTSAAILAGNSPVRETAEALAPRLREQGLDWQDLDHLLAVRRELCEIDLRFGQVWPPGIFAAIEEQLDHAMPGVDHIDDAVRQPPSSSRAMLRGHAVQQLAGTSGSHAGWTYVVNGQGRIMHLRDPFARTARWVRQEEVETVSLRHLSTIETRQASISRSYNRGDYRRVCRVIEQMIERMPVSVRFRLDPLQPYLAWARSRLGRVDEAREVLDDLARRRRAGLAVEYVSVLRFQALAPHGPEIWTWIRRVEVMRRRGLLDRTVTANFLGHHGYTLARAGRIREALATLREACALQELPGNHRRYEARNLADLADVLRILGHRDEAADQLTEAERICTGSRFSGELAEFVLLGRAKLEADPERALEHCRRARRILWRLGHPVALIRTMLLMARLTTHRHVATRHRRRIEAMRLEIPDLLTCPRLARILQRWDQWANRAESQEHGDGFWLV